MCVCVCRGGGGGGSQAACQYTLVLRCSRWFRFSEGAARSAMTLFAGGELVPRLFQNGAPEKAMLVLNKSIFGLGTGGSCFWS